MFFPTSIEFDKIHDMLCNTRKSVVHLPHHGKPSTLRTFGIPHHDRK
jgi:hypothetical protein